MTMSNLSEHPAPTQRQYFLSCVSHEFRSKLRSKLSRTTTLEETMNVVKDYIQRNDPILSRRISFLQSIKNCDKIGTQYFEETFELWYQCDMESLSPENLLSLICPAGYKLPRHIQEILKDKVDLPSYESMLRQVRNMESGDGTLDLINV